jgi:integrase
MRQKRNHEGIEVRHARSCRSQSGGSCNCKPTYRGNVWSNRDGKQVRSKAFPSFAAAKSWRADASVALAKGELRAPSPLTVKQAADQWLERAKAGAVRNRSGDPFKPSALRGYEQALRDRVLPALGSYKLSDVRRPDAQELADKLMGEGHNPSTIRNALMPLRALFRWHLARGDVAVNPTTGIELPAVRGKRERIAGADEAGRLIAALPATERCLWATAFYGGLRLGELLALDWSHVNLAEGTLNVQRSWDAKEGMVEPKSRAGRRRIPIAAVLRDHLVEHRMGEGRTTGLVFGRTEARPFCPSTVYVRARKAWKAAKLAPITLHEARHTYASLMIAAGVNAKALSTYMGHASVTITYDRYGHLMPGNEEEAAGLLDAYLERANTQARLAQLQGAG